MIANGVPDQKIKDYVQQNGIDGTNIDQILQFRNTKDFQDWKRQNPGAAYPLGPSFYTNQVPMSAARQTFNEAASTGVGGAAAAFPVAAGNALTGDRAGSLMGPQAQIAMQLMRNNHPVSSVLGDAAGQALAQELVPGSGILPTIGKDLLYGAYSGSGDNGPGAIPGALVGAATGAVGRGTQTLAGGALKGVSNASLGYLDKQGVPLTLGQIGKGSSNVVGRTVGGLEDRISGLPGFDAIINGARRRGIEGFDTAAFKQAGGSGATGSQGLAELNNLRGNAYSFLDGTQISVDPQFTDAQGAVRATLPNMTADHATGVGGVLNNIDNTTANGVMTGRDFQSNLQALRGARSSISGQPYSDLPRTALGTADDNLIDLAARNGPEGTIPNLASANQLHANTETLLNAVGKPGSQASDELFSPTSLNASAINGARKYQGSMAALTGNRPFYDLTKAGMDVMPKDVPDSGTAGRLAVLGALTALSGGIGAGVGAADGEDEGEGAREGGEKGLGYGLLLGGLALGPYSKVGQNVIQRALLAQRPRAISSLGGLLINNSATGGAIAQAMARNNAYSLGDLARMNQLTNFNN
jgi:SLT domain-containing protein